MGRRRMIKAAVILITLGYCSLLVYQGSVTLNAFNLQESRPGSVQVLSIEPLTKPSVNDSGQSKNITLDDIFISIKTTKHHRDTRLPIILKTWFQLAKDQTWFFTDTDNQTQQQLTNGHLVNTNCSDTHQRKHLCCKTSVEYDTFMDSGKKWFCHFDDDNYVNVPRLVEVLQGYDYQMDWYLGRNSIPKPVKYYKPHTKKAQITQFWFATFGAGVCISRSLALKMIPVVSGGKFISICERIRLPDDVTMGYVIEKILQQKLTIVPEFHSHLEQMKLIPSDIFREQISFSYSPNNTVDVPGFNASYDPTRFLSLHCFLFPHFEFCPR
ncbi:fringe-like domain-containing protein [Phthorimaea operculella]|nr:fringe-like domain-containing protein [Phthorimaea operculella]